MFANSFPKDINVDRNIFEKYLKHNLEKDIIDKLPKNPLELITLKKEKNSCELIIKKIHLMITGNINQILNSGFSDEIIIMLKNIKDIFLDVDTLHHMYKIKFISMQNLKIDLLFFNNVIKDIYKVKKFSQFIKYIDQYNGCLPQSDNDFNYEVMKKIIITNI